MRDRAEERAEDLSRASKQKFLCRLYIYLGRGDGKDLRSCPYATLQSNHTVFTWMTSYLGLLRVGGSENCGSSALDSVLGE